MSVRALFADLGTGGVAAVSLATLAVWMGAYLDLHRAQGLYLSLASFHGYLELALLIFFWVRGDNAAHGSRPALCVQADEPSPALHTQTG